MSRASKMWVFRHVDVIWHNWAKNGPTMGVVARQAPVGVWGPRILQKFGHGHSLLGNCYLENKFHKKIRVTPFHLNNNNY